MGNTEMTFDELVKYGRRQPDANIVRGMPWSFTLRGYAVTHENDDCYLICTRPKHLRIERGDTLIITPGGELSICRKRLQERQAGTGSGWQQMERKEADC